MDLEKGKIIREFLIDGANPALDMCHEEKFGDMTPNPVFNCLNAKNIFKMDPRIAKGVASAIKVAEKIYSKNLHFTTI